MKKLYLKLIELLSEIKEIKYIDLNFGQLQEEKPPLAYPAILVNMGIRSSENFHDVFQQINADFTLTLVVKSSDTSSLSSEEVRDLSLAYLDLQEKIYQKLQGYEDKDFENFSRESAVETNVRKRVKTISIRYSTGWKEQTKP